MTSRSRARQRRIVKRLDKFNFPDDLQQTILRGANIQYEVAQRSVATPYGGIGLVHQLVKALGLPTAIDQRLHLFKIHLPYHESDHVLNMAYNALCDGRCLQDLELRRQDEAYLNALGACRIPDPTTAGDFCRRFQQEHLGALQEAIDVARLKAWSGQPDSFFEQAVIDADGTIVETDGECKQGMDISYKGQWGYHPLAVTLANTGEVLRLVNRPGNRPSHDGAAEQVDRALAACFRGGFRRVLLRGDTDFSQTEHLDRWDADGRVRFIFGYNAMPNLVDIAQRLPERVWQPLQRPPRYMVQTEPRQRPERVKEQIVVERAFENKHLQAEEVAEFNYQPTACRETYRMVVVWKNISVAKGEKVLFDEVVYLFYLTNDWLAEMHEIVFAANERCHQENILAQLLGGVRALHAPVDNLVSNGAYMVMTSLAWNLKAWWALTLPEMPGRWHDRHRTEKQWVLGIEFRTFLNAFVRLPCQIVRTGRRLVYRLLAWNPYQGIFFRLVSALRC